MHGNVSEWVLDQYSKTYEPLRKAVAAGELPIHWPTQLHPRTVRGGSCPRLSQQDEPNVPRSPCWLASSLQRQIGFRIARPLDPPPLKSQGQYWDADVDELKKAVAIHGKHGHSFIGPVDPKLPAAIKQYGKK